MNNKTMTNKTIETIKNNSNPTTEELFDLINLYGITMLSIQDENHKTMTEMDVNHFVSHKSEYEFG